MRKIICTALSTALLLGILAGCGGQETTPPAVNTPSGAVPATSQPGGDVTYPTMKLSVAALDSADKAKAHDIQLFTDLVTERSGGAITFDVYYNAQLGKATDNLTTIGSGIADLGTVCTLYTPSNLPLSQITYCIPFAPSDPNLAAQLMYRVSQEHPEFYGEYEKNGVVCLAWKGNEPYKLYSKNSITSTSQLNGMKLTLGGVYYIPWFESIGAVPVSAPAADLYQTIKTGVATGSFVYDSIYCDYKLYEVEDYCLEVGLGARNNDTICINKAVWDSLDDATKTLFQACADEAMAEFQQWEQEQMDGWVEEMKSNGVTISPLSDEEKASWAETALTYQDTLQTWIDDVTALGYDGAAIMSTYIKAGEELGYTWAFDTAPYIQ